VIPQMDVAELAILLVFTVAMFSMAELAE